MGGALSSAAGLCGVGSCASNLACCCGSSACSLCCKSCPSTTTSTSTRIVYAVFLLLSSIAAWVMLSPKISEELPHMSRYTGTIGSCEKHSPDYAPDDCDSDWGQLGVYRVMFGPTVFFAALALLMIGVKNSRDGRSGIQNGFWAFKFLILAGATVGAFFINNHFFKAWGVIGLIGGFCFLVCQLILLVDFAHSWAESWIAKMEEGSGCHKFGLIVSTIGMYLASFVCLVLLYVFYTKSDDSSCGLNKFFISFHLILSVIATVMSVHPKIQEAVPSSGLLQPAVVTFYNTYVTWSAVSNTSSSCAPNSSSTGTVVVGAILTVVAVVYASLRTSSASQLGKLGMGDENENKTLLLDDEEEEGDEEEVTRQKVVDSELNGVEYKWSFFHMVFAFASLYIMMLLTDWAVIRDGQNATIRVGEGMASTWVKVVSSWITWLLYGWTLVAPIVLPDRVFN